MSTELQDLTVEQLRALAGERGIEIPEKAKKAEIISAIEEAQAAAAEAEAQATAGDTPTDTAGDPSAADPASEQASEGDTPADTSGDTPTDTSDAADAPVETGFEREDGLVEIRRPIEQINDRGDWICPFSGLRVMASSLICPQSGAHRDGDEAYIVTEPDEAS